MQTIRTAPIHLSELKTKEGVERFQILKTGKFYDDRYGEFDITEKMLSEMVSNFDAGVRGVDIMLDYKHDTEAEAAGWFKSLSVEPFGDGHALFADIDLTPPGRKKLSDKEFRYLSADFDPDYHTNERPVKKCGCVLLGAALTNRPVIKGMAPAVQLGEQPYQGNNTMDDKNKLAEMEKKLADMESNQQKLMEAVGVSSPDELLKKIEEMKTPKVEIEAGEEMKKELSEMKDKLAKLESEKDTAEKESKFNLLLAEKKAVPAQRDAFMKGDMAEFAAKAQALNFSEKGHGDVPADLSKEDAEKQLSEKASEIAKSKGVMFSEALKIARKENPKLAEKAI